MKMFELAAYAKQKYNIDEDRKWADFSFFSVLAHPQTKKWAALLMRKDDKSTGEITEICDIKCPTDAEQRAEFSFLSEARRIHGKNWTGVKFDDTTDREFVFRMFDKAVEKAGEQQESGYSVVLDNSDNVQNEYGDTAIPYYAKGTRRKSPEQSEEILPKKIIELRRLMKSNFSLKPTEDYIITRARKFYEQAVFMEDYSDDAPCSDYFFNYYPTYDVLNTKLLRGYFTWRTKVRAGEYPYIAPSLAYIYIYELLNGVGADSSEEVLSKLDEFENGFLEDEKDVASLRDNLARWKFEFCIINGLPVETALKYANPKTVEKDEALIILKNPKEYADKEVFDSLMLFAEKARRDTPTSACDERAAHRIFADAWRKASKYKEENKNLFELCFGKLKSKKRYPLYNAVYYDRLGGEKRTYKLNDARIYKYDGKSWHMKSYERLYFNLSMLRGFMHETDRKVRLYLKTGRNLREKPGEEWAQPYIDEAIAEFEKERIEAERPKISIEISNLEKIRRDAADTRESLLTDEERGADPAIKGEYVDKGEPSEADTPIQNVSSNIKSDAPQAAPDNTNVLNETQTAVLKALLSGGSANDILKKVRIMPTIAADEINDAIFDLIGDNVIETSDDGLILIEDYRKEVADIIKGDKL